MIMMAFDFLYLTFLFYAYYEIDSLKLFCLEIGKRDTEIKSIQLIKIIGKLHWKIYESVLVKI